MKNVGSIALKDIAVLWKRGGMRTGTGFLISQDARLQTTETYSR